MKAARPRHLPAGESALVVEFGETIDPAVNDRVLALDAAIAAARQSGALDGVLECVPTYRSLMVCFDPRRWSMGELARALEGLESAPITPARQKLWRIPACYDAPHAEDLAEIASILGLPQDEIIAAHLGARYRIYMYGFAPGFTFLGGLPAELAISRRAVPRAPAPPGALLIAGGQALIASIAMPTGWYMVGRTPFKVFDPRREKPFFADVGDEVAFERIDAAAFDAFNRDGGVGG